MIAPVTGVAVKMGDRDNNNFIGMLTVYDSVRESVHQGAAQVTVNLWQAFGNAMMRWMARSTSSRNSYPNPAA